NLFPVESGGAAIWGPQTFNGQSGTGLGPKVSVVQGRFNLLLGPKDTGGRDLAGVFAANPSVFIELKVGSGNPISPRQQVVSSPYALNSVNAAKLKGFDWGALFDNGSPQTGSMGLGVTLPAPGFEPVKLDVNGRLRARQGTDGSAGMWLSQNTIGDRAFVGMLNNDSVGFYTKGAGWAFTVDVNTGVSSATTLAASEVDASEVHLGPARLTGDDSTVGGIRLKSFFVSGVDNSYFEGDVWATRFQNSSDQRLKENIETIEEPLEKIQAIRGVRFNFKDNTPRKSLNSHERRIDDLAQEVQKVLPEAVTAAPDGYLSVDYNALVPVLLQAVK